ncbi:GNAT family N-acetyltransferase [Plantibacter sp. YIM 135249]|uniref:GNAT family N-acetyltransferase n=1 Tax=Plantibacter sp. YIM 135249 TaxID=3423918 RepID=UPI003D3323B2
MSPALRHMPADRLTVWMVETTESYRLERIKAGESEAEASANAERSFSQLFPGGELAPGQLVFEILEDAAAGPAPEATAASADPIGILWVGPTLNSTTDWWVWNIEIVESHRGRGLGREAMRLAEVQAREHGADSLGLNVFGFNVPARSLYESLGYETTSLQMRKTL